MSGGVKNIVIGGGTGNIGKYLVKRLVNNGHNVSVITRHAWSLNKAKGTANSDSKMIKARTVLPQSFISWKDIDKDGLPLDTDVVINLSGKTIGQPGPWVNSLKKMIEESRVNTTKQLVKAIEKSEDPPKTFISASAVGVYGLDASRVYTEADDPVAPGKENFFTKLCEKWEASSKLPEGSGTRVVNPRFGVVLAHDTMPMRLLLPQAGMVGPSIVGPGTQPFPWIHIADTVSALCHVIENEDVTGPVNFVAPQIVDNTEFTNALATACGTSVSKLLTLPTFVVRLMYGTERADGILLDSPKVLPQKLLDLGFEFEHGNIDSAMKAIVESAGQTEAPGSAPLKAILAKRKKAA